MAWQLTGELIESCSCNMLCPCWFGVPDLMKMDQGWCASPLLFRIKAGRVDGTDLASRTVVVGAFFPGPTLVDGNGTARLYIDSGATAAQREALEAVFQGKKGGPMEILAGLMTTWLPTASCDIDVRDDGQKLEATVGAFGEIRSEVLHNSDGGRMTLKGSGFGLAFQFEDGGTFAMAPSGSRWTDPELPRTFETRSGGRGAWTWKVA